MLAAKPNSIRIQSGSLRGRNITFPDRPGLRPATGEMRETLFNWLRPHIQGMNILDAFAGSGALGFEALSQGAHKVDAFEIDTDAYTAIQENQTRLSETLNYSVTQGDFTTHWNPYNHYDAIFLDPPYQSDLLQKSLVFLQDKIPSNTWVFIHYPLGLNPCLDEWTIIKTKTRQKRCYSLLKTKQKD